MKNSVIKILMVLIMVLSAQLGFAQYSYTHTLSDGSSVTIDISVASVVVSSTSCQNGYNYNLEMNYKISFSSSGNSLNQARITGLPDNKGGNFNIDFNNKTVGEYNQVTTTNVWTNDNDCNSITPDGLGLGDMTLLIQETGQTEQSVVVPPGSGTYPIDLIHFSAKASNSIVEINWATATEENNDFFTIERSQDGDLWEVVSEVMGAGNSNELLEYQVVDQMPLSGISYYRLKQTDFDGAYTYSKVVAVNMDEKLEIPISVYPNPATNRIQISTEQSEIDEIHIFNMLGQEFTAEVSISQSGESQFAMDISSLPVGVYIIRTNNSFVKVYKQ